MYKKDLVDVVSDFERRCNASIDTLIEVSNLHDDLEADDDDAIRKKIGYMANRCKAEIPKEIEVEKVSTRAYVSLIGDSRMLKVTMENGRKSRYKFKAERTFLAGDTYIDIKNFIVTFFVNLLYASAEQSNLNELNEMLDGELQSLGKDFRIRFITDLFAERRTPIVDISDKEVTLLAKEDNILSLADTFVMYENDNEVLYEDAKPSIEKQRSDLRDDLAAMETVLDAVNTKNKFLHYIWDMPRGAKVSPAIRKSVSNNVAGIYKKKGLNAYYHDKDSHIYGIIHRDKDGEISVVLSPFDTVTLERVDFDLVGKAKELVK